MVHSNCPANEEATLVCHLIDEEHGGWKIDKIKQLFSPTKANGYHMLMSKKYEGSSSTSQCNDSLWKKLWKAKCIPKCKDLMWRACQNILPVRTRLIQRGMIIDPSCPICEEGEETITHALLTCRQAAQVWFASTLAIRSDHGSVSTLLVWVSQILQQDDSKTATLVCQTAWAIWTTRESTYDGPDLIKSDFSGFAR
ncbi:hypothetical protein RIF29_24375 [Crotalaria pallida]|uniref:Reverse transcriptase zinc-binding domain-containing protein n=1 Tax=Crotalaria pallida TaxID=3830 RepID=A0AAN9HWI9_CROPI